HADQQVVEESIDLSGTLLQQLDVIADRIDLVQGHPAHDAAVEGAGLVKRKIDARARAQKHDKRAQLLIAGEKKTFDVLALLRYRTARLTSLFRRDVRMPGETRKFLRDLLRSHHKIDAAAADGAARHAEVFGSALVLRKGDATLAFDFRHAQCAVGAAAGQNDANRAVLLFDGKGAEENIDGGRNAA